jgi:glycerophosphoryl diester phosphodiesterase
MMAAKVRFIGHAGLAKDRPGGTPTRHTLADAEQLNVDWIEIDVCCSSDGTLLLRHDLALPSGRRVGSVDVAAVRREDPDVLTLDEAAEVLDGGRAPVLVDLKDAADVAAVAGWLGRRADPSRWAICTDDRDALLTARERAPKVERWRGVPRVAPGRGEPVRRIAAMTLRSLLPARLDRLAREVGAAAFTVDRWAVTPALCAAAARLELPVAAWTVNSASVARRMAACGVDLLTTDRVAEMRAALAAQDRAVTGRCDG